MIKNQSFCNTPFNLPSTVIFLGGGDVQRGTERPGMKKVLLGIQKLSRF